MSTLSRRHKDPGPTGEGFCSCLFWWAVNEKYQGTIRGSTVDDPPEGLKWCGDAGFCDEPAYGPALGGKYADKCGGLACPRHGGPTKEMGLQS